MKEHCMAPATVQSRLHLRQNCDRRRALKDNNCHTSATTVNVLSGAHLQARTAAKHIESKFRALRRPFNFFRSRYISRHIAFTMAKRVCTTCAKNFSGNRNYCFHSEPCSRPTPWDFFAYIPSQLRRANPKPPALSNRGRDLVNLRRCRERNALSSLHTNLCRLFLWPSWLASQKRWRGQRSSSGEPCTGVMPLFCCPRPHFTKTAQGDPHHTNSI